MKTIINPNSKILNRVILIIIVALIGCAKLDPPTGKDRPLTAEEKRKRNIAEGRGASIGDLIGRGGSGTTYEFSTSNPMWRASLETLDFLPLTTVDYSGGVIITDWYSENSNNLESIKITIRFLSNEIRSDSMKIILHKKVCNNDLKCNTSLVSSSLIKDELRSTILRKASLLQKKDKQKK